MCFNKLEIHIGEITLLPSRITSFRSNNRCSIIISLGILPKAIWIRWICNPQGRNRISSSRSSKSRKHMRVDSRQNNTKGKVSLNNSLNSHPRVPTSLGKHNKTTINHHNTYHQIITSRKWNRILMKWGRILQILTWMISKNTRVTIMTFP